MAGTRVAFETHATTRDNELGAASGWNPGRLSDRGRTEAVELGRRRADPRPDLVATSDLERCTDTVAIAFGDQGPPLLVDPRLRECDYGLLNGAPRLVISSRWRFHLDVPHFEGETWRDAVERVTSSLVDLIDAHRGTSILVVGHRATWLALETLLGGRRLEDVVDHDVPWRPGWEYVAT